MIDDEPTFHRIRAVCRTREVDLMMSPAPAPFVLRLRGHYDRYNTFFEILAKDVEYLELAGDITVGDMLLTNDMHVVAGLSPKWQHLAEECIGHALVLLDKYAESWGTARPEQLFLIVADLTFREGPDWAKVVEHSGT